MYLFRKIILSSFWIILLNGISIQATEASSRKPHCEKAEYLLGTWYGIYQNLFDRVNSTLVLEVNKINGCMVEGSMLFPEIYNSKINFRGKVAGQKLLIENQILVQGYNINHQSPIEFTLNSGDTLRASWVHGEEELARCELVNEKLLSDRQKEFVTLRIQGFAVKYGSATFSAGQDKTDHSTFWGQYHKANKNTLSGKALEFKGKAEVEQKEIGIYALIQYPDKVYMETIFKDRTDLLGVNENEFWYYNASWDNLQVDKNDEKAKNSLNRLPFSLLQPADMLKEGYEVKSILNAKLDSLQAYRVVLAKEGKGDVVFFIDKRNYQVIRKEQDNWMKLHFQHQKINGLYFPRVSYMFHPKQTMVYHLSEINLKQDVNNSIFQVPEELKKKAKKPEKRKKHQKDTTNSEEINSLGIEKYEKGEYEEAIEAYSKAIQLNPSKPIYYENRGSARKESGDYYGAISDYNTVLAFQPKNVRVINLMGLAKYNLGDYQNAIHDFTRAIENDDSGYLTPYSNRANAYIHLGETQKAAEDFGVLIKKDSSNGKWWYSFGAMQAELGQFREAVEHYQQAISLGYVTDETYNRLGVAYYRQGNFEKALVNFKEAVSRDSTDYLKLQNLADTYAELKEFHKSNEFYEKSLRLTEYKADIYNQIGMNYYLQEIYNTARDKFSLAIQEDPENVQYYQHRALAETALEDYSGAIDDYTTAISLYPKDPELFVKRGLLWIRQHNRHQGCHDFKKAHSLGHVRVQELLSQYCSMETED